MADTGFLSPAATGEDYADWSNPSNAFTSDNTRTGNVTTGSQDYYNFGFSIPAGATINGIEVQTEGAGSVSPTPIVGIELSWNGGGTYTGSGHQNTHSGGTDTTDTSGGATNTWGRTWASTDFNDSNFRLKLTHISSLFAIDHVRVKVYYTEAVGFTNPTNAYSSNDTYATIAATTGDISVQLSGDGGTTYSSSLTKTFTGSESTETYGNGSTELWGLSWTGDNVDDTSFRVKVTVGSQSQIYKTFGFAPGASVVLTGVEVAIEAKWDGATTSIDHVKVKIYYGTSTTPVQAGSLAYDSTLNKLAYYNGSAWKYDMVASAPTFTDFTNAPHDHGDADDGGAIVAGAIPEAFFRGRYQQNTTDAAVTGETVQRGWGFLVGSGTDDMEEAVTFDEAFAAAPFVMVSFAGFRTTASGAPNSIDDFDSQLQASPVVVATRNISTTGFTVSFTRSDAAVMANTINWGYTWLAIGAI